MKFLFGFFTGAAAAWYYFSRQPDLSEAPRMMEQARQTVGSAAAAGAQRAAEVIDRAPVPPQAKDVVNRVTSNLSSGAPSSPATSGATSSPTSTPTSGSGVVPTTPTTPMPPSDPSVPTVE